MKLTGTKKTSVHLGPNQAGLFINNGQILEIKQKKAFSGLDSAWVRKVPEVILARESAVFLHLDVRLPFGEEVTHELVEQELREKLGAKRNEFGLSHWISYFNEDTQHGTLFRLLVVFEPADHYEKQQPLSDLCFPIEYGILSLGAQIQEEIGKGEFQFVLTHNQNLYSLIHYKNGPYHLLKIPMTEGTDYQERLKKQSDWVKSKNDLERISVQRGLESQLNITDSFRFVDLKFLSGSKGVNPILPGLVQAASNPEIREQNETTPEVLTNINNIRSGKVFFQSLITTIIILMIIGGVVYSRLASGKNVLKQYAVQEKAHSKILADIEELKKSQTDILKESENLKSIWFPSLPVHHVIDDIKAALPPNSGLYGLRLEKGGTHQYKITFKAWVKNWDHVSSIKKSLEALPYVKSTEMSNQKRNLKKDVIVFQVVSVIKE